MNTQFADLEVRHQPRTEHTVPLMRRCMSHIAHLARVFQVILRKSRSDAGTCAVAHLHYGLSSQWL